MQHHRNHRSNVEQKINIDGLFEVTRTRLCSPVCATNRLVLVCRKGRLFGADPKGRVYTGELQSRPHVIPFKSVLKGTYEVPLRCRGPTAFAVAAPSYTIPVSGEIDPFARSQNATILIGGKRVDVRVNYLGPLPD